MGSSNDASPLTSQSVLVINIQGIVPSLSSKSHWKLDYLSTILNNSDKYFPFVFLTETWCKSYMTDAQLHIPNYSVYRADRKLRHRGGSLIYIHDSILVSTSLNFDNQYVEVVIAHMEDIRCSVICLYRPPNCPVSKFNEALLFIQEHIRDQDHGWNIIIAGDFNLPIIDWSSASLDRKSVV